MSFFRHALGAGKPAVMDPFVYFFRHLFEDRVLSPTFLYASFHAVMSADERTGGLDHRVFLWNIRLLNSRSGN